MGSFAAGAAESDEDEQRPLTYGITPFAGYRVGGTFKSTETDTHADVRDHLSYGLALDLSTDQSSQYEVFYSRQSTILRGPSLAPADITIQYLHIGGSVSLADWSRLQPYLVATAGATRFSPGAHSGIDSTHFSASLGTGLRIPLNSHLALRLEARGFATFLNTNTNVFCRSNQAGGLCLVHGSGSTFIQGEALAGLNYIF
jgi:opacity protein-like surface antigen